MNSYGKFEIQSSAFLMAISMAMTKINAIAI